MRVPARVLDRHVASVRAWPTVPSGTTRYVERLPDGTATIVFRGPTQGGRGDLSAVGAVSRAVYKEAPSELRVISVDFKLGGAYPFFGIPMHALTDRHVPLEELWGPEALALLDRLLGCRDEARAVELMEQALVARLQRAADLELRSAMHVLRAVRRLVAYQPTVDVAGLSAAVGLSERQLRRVFATAVGVGPKEYLRMLRFNRAVQSAALPGGQLAVAAGYYDQAHLISEFRHLARMTPRDFANRHRRNARNLRHR